MDIDWFTPGCPCCMEEIGLGQGPLPKPSKGSHRHPQSDPTESARNVLTQCQYCWKSKAPGVTLLRCSGCKVDIYCSKECQKKAWPSHKEKCRLNSRNGPITEEHGIIKQLQKFTSKHRPTLADAAVRALDLSLDPKRSLRYVLVVFLRIRENSKRVETSFYATGAEVLSLDAFPPEKAEEMREQLRKVDEGHRQQGMLGGLFVVLMCLEQAAFNIAPVGFAKATLYPPGTPWKEWMIGRLNEGIVS